MEPSPFRLPGVSRFIIVVAAQYTQIRKFQLRKLNMRTMRETHAPRRNIVAKLTI